MRAFNLIRPGPVYRREAFDRGLEAAGLNVSSQVPALPGPDDVLVIWNRYAEYDAIARRVEAAGGRVLVAENGYLGYGARSHRAHDLSARRMYALALFDHGGRGAWPTLPGGRRFPQLGVELKAWTRAGHAAPVLVCAQRGIGSPFRASPPSWAEKVAAELRKAGIASKVRAHPGDKDPRVSLEADLEGCQACVVWSSGAGVKALVEGVPVFYACPWWICSDGARRYLGPGSIGAPVKNDLQRELALERMAWAQWTVEEISSGEPFRLLLSMPYPIKRGVNHA
jgi:hypothetical protein